MRRLSHSCWRRLAACDGPRPCAQVVGAVGWGNARLQIPAGSHPAIASLITRCWSEPKARPTFAEILQYLKPLGEEIFVCPPKAGSASSDSADLDASEAS